mmetsp:Transcript_33763/g.54154  ORF Transcript_33763/g.54154 Transcript_33763/m.54154 type:complete len:846 (-) Transcript_33763:1592-4129(-)
MDTPENLASQLASQVSYTNELLVQVQELENAQLNAQKDAQAKQIALKQAMAVCDSVRADQSELRKRLTMAQELASRATNDAKKWKIDCDVKSREMEGLQKYVSEARTEIDSLQKIDADREQKFIGLLEEKDELERKLEESAREESSRVARHRHGHEQASKELAELRSQFQPLQAEMRLYKGKCDDLDRALKTRDAELSRQNEDLDRAKRHIAQLEENERNLNLLHAQFKSDLHNEQSRAERTQQQVEAAESIAEARQKELDDARNEAAELNGSNRALQDEIRSLNAELEIAKNEMGVLSQAKTGEKDKLESFVKQLQDELAALASDAREREKNSSEQLRARTAEHGKQRKEADAQNAKLQEENNQLHSLLQNTQAAMESQTAQYQLEREDMEARFAKVQEMLHSAEEDIARRETDSKRNSTSLLGEIQRLQNEMAARSAQEVESLGILQNTIEQLRADSQDLQEDYVKVLSELENLQKESENKVREEMEPLKQWHIETKRTIADLAEANNTARIEYENVREMQLAGQVQLDEARGNVTSLTEENERLQEEIKYLEGNLSRMEEASRDRLQNAKLDYESAASEQDQMSKRLRSVMDQLEEVNAQNGRLQEERQRANENLASTQARLGQRVTALESELDANEAKMRHAIQERDTVQADRELMKRAMEESANAIKNLQNQLAALETQRRDGADRERKYSKTFEEQLTVQRENSRKLQTQLQQTKSLLKVVQDQRKHLQEDNMALRAELDDVLRRSLEQPVVSMGVVEDMPVPDTREPPEALELNNAPVVQITHSEDPILVQPETRNSPDTAHQLEKKYSEGAPTSNPLDLDIEKLRREVEQLKAETEN